MTWYGWLWVRGQWRAVCQGATVASCSKLLSVEAERLGIRRNTHRALTGGRPPSWTPGKARHKAPVAPQGSVVQLEGLGTG